MAKPGEAKVVGGYVRVTIGLRPDVYRRLRERAKRNHRSLTGEMIYLMERGEIGEAPKREAQE